MSKQMEFDFEQYQEPRRADTNDPTVEYIRKAFDHKEKECKQRAQLIEFLKTGTVATILSTDSAERKNTPMYSGALMYFPLALAAVARHSKRSNDKHNPGEPLHWSRAKSDDHMDCIIRHAVDVEHFNAELNEYEEACALAWRALAKLQLLEEKRLGKEPK